MTARVSLAEARLGCFDGAYLHDGFHCFIIDGLFLGAAVARSETGKVDIGQRLENALLQAFVHLLVGQMVTDGVGREERELDVEFVGDAAPEGFVDLLVEERVVAVVEVALGVAQALAGQFGGALQTHAAFVAGDGLLTAYPSHHHNGGHQGNQHQQPEPEAGMCVAAQGAEVRMLLDVVDVAVQLGHVAFLVAVVAFGHFELDGVAMKGDILSRRGVEIDVVEGRNLVVALGLRCDDPLEGAAAAEAAVALDDIVHHARLVDIQALGKGHLRSFEQAQVAPAADGDAIGHRFAGTQLFEVAFHLDVEVSHTAREAFGRLGQGLDVDIDGIAGERFDHGLLLGGCEEGIVDEKVEDGAGALSLHLGHDDGHDIGLQRGDVECAGFLREERAAPYLGHLILASVDGFGILFHLGLSFAEVFAPEAFVARQFFDLELG